MVTVVATQELEPGDVLRRFKQEAAQDEPRRGNNNIVVVGLAAVGVWKLPMNMRCFSLVCGSFLVCVCVCVCDDDDDDDNDDDWYCFSYDVLYKL